MTSSFVNYVSSFWEPTTTPTKSSASATTARSGETPFTNPELWRSEMVSLELARAKFMKQQDSTLLKEKEYLLLDAMTPTCYEATKDAYHSSSDSHSHHNGSSTSSSSKTKSLPALNQRAMAYYENKQYPEAFLYFSTAMKIALDILDRQEWQAYKTSICKMGHLQISKRIYNHMEMEVELLLEEEEEEKRYQQEEEQHQQRSNDSSIPNSPSFLSSQRRLRSSSFFYNGVEELMDTHNDNGNNNDALLYMIGTLWFNMAQIHRVCGNYEKSILCYQRGCLSCPLYPLVRSIRNMTALFVCAVGDMDAPQLVNEVLGPYAQSIVVEAQEAYEVLILKHPKGSSSKVESSSSSSMSKHETGRRQQPLASSTTKQSRKQDDKMHKDPTTTDLMDNNNTCQGEEEKEQSVY